MISITNQSYLDLAIKNRPFVGWNSDYSRGEITASGLMSGSPPASAIWSPNTDTGIRQSVSLSTSVSISIEASLQNVNYVAIAGHNYSDFPGLRVQVRYGTSVVDEINNIADDSAIIFYFDDSGPVSDLNIHLIEPASSYASVFITSHVKVGQALILDRPMWVGQKQRDKRVEKVRQRSDSGKYLGQVVTSQNRLYAINQQNNDRTFIDDYIDDFLDHCDGVLPDGLSDGPQGSFFYAERPAQYPNNTMYCHAPGSVNRPSNQRSNGMREWSISGSAE